MKDFLTHAPSTPGNLPEAGSENHNRLTDFTSAYLRSYAAGGGHTARAKNLDTQHFIEFMKRYRDVKSSDELQVSTWDFSATQHFVDECLRLGEAPSTVCRRLATLKHMGRILAEKVPGFLNPAREVKAPKIQVLRPQSVSAEEIAEIRNIASSRCQEKSTFNRVRNQTLLCLLLDTGLRADEVRALRVNQLDEHLEWIDKVRTKGRRFRKVYITSQMRPALANFLVARRDELRRIFPTITNALGAKLPLFLSFYGAKIEEHKSFEMSPKSVWRAIRECSAETKLHPHLLRHTYAAELLKDSRDIRLVAQALGHSDVRVTMRYTERADEEVAKALEKTRRSGQTEK